MNGAADPSQGQVAAPATPAANSLGPLPPALDDLLTEHGSDCLRGVLDLPPASLAAAPWPSTIGHAVRDAFAGIGVHSLFEHQRAAIEEVLNGRHVAVSTGTASGKSLAYLVPAAQWADGGAKSPTVLYISPTKALARDQLRRVESLGMATLRPAPYDGDTPGDDRRWVRRHANFVATNPDMLHRSILPGHAAWASFLRRLRLIVVDEFHTYRGVFGAHLAAILRRLLRLAKRYDARPTVVGASATAADPAETLQDLIGQPCTGIATDQGARGRVQLALWEPPVADHGGSVGLVAHTADLLAGLVSGGARTLAFVRSRKAAEVVARRASERIAQAGDDPGVVASYRSGYLPEERRLLERQLREGQLRGLVATSALELGIDVAGLDAVVVAGWPGTRSSLRQRIGRAGRSGQSSLAVFIADDNPLDRYLIRHPDQVLGSHERIVLDPSNSYVLAPHLCAAAAEAPLTDAEAEQCFGPTAPALLEVLGGRALLRRRRAGWFWTRRDSPTDLADLRGTGGTPVSVIEHTTGRLIATVDTGAADRTVHEGAVYTHLGIDHLVQSYDPDECVAVAEVAEVPFSTQPMSVSDNRILQLEQVTDWGAVRVGFGAVEVSSQVVGFLRRRVSTGEVVGQQDLQLPIRTLRTKAVWYTVPGELLDQAGIEPGRVAGSAHAAEHAAIALLPLIAQCDRWDIGGLSTEHHPDTGMTTVFVHDGQAGGAGFAASGFAQARRWLGMTAQAIADCPCEQGCPLCVQSPKCGNGNEPLDKAGAVALLRAVLAT